MKTIRRRGRWIDLPDVAAKTDLRRLIADDLGQVPDKSGRYRCPFHQDNNPSLSVYRASDRDRFRCHACTTSGDAIEYLMKRYPELSALNAARHLVDRGFSSCVALPVSPRAAGGGKAMSQEEAAPPEAPSTDKKESTSSSVDYLPRLPAPGPSAARVDRFVPVRQAQPIRPQPTGGLNRSMSVGIKFLNRETVLNLWTPAGLEALQWLERRGLAHETIRAAGLGCSLRDGFGLGHSGVYVPRGIWIPFFTPDGSPAGGQIRRLSTGYGDPEDGNKFHLVGPRGILGRLYRGPVTSGLNKIIICEGALDALLLGQVCAGLDVEVVALLSAAVRCLDQASLDSLRGRRVILATDADDAGDAAAAYWIGLLGDGATRARVPRGKDIGEFHARRGDLKEWVARL